MFSSKFLSGANPLSAVSSAVNKFGIFGDDGDGDKNQKPPPQQGVKPPGDQQPGGGPGKSPQQQQRRQTSGQPPPTQQKQGTPQNGQAGPQNKPGGQQVAAKEEGKQPGSQIKGGPQNNQPKGPPQQGSPKPGAQQQNVTKSGAQPESAKGPQQQAQSKTGMQQQGPAKTDPQQKEPIKTGVQGSPKAVPQKSGSQQGSPKAGQQPQGSPRTGQQPQGSPRTGQQPQGSPRTGQQQQGTGKLLQQQPQGSPKAGQQQQGLRTTPQQSSEKGPKGPGTPGQSRAGSSSPGVTKAGSQAKAVAKTLCPVCSTTELNTHTKEPPNYKTCTQCKSEVCSLCGFSPPDSDGREWLCLTCQIQRAQGAAEPSGPPMKKAASPAPAKKEISAPGSPHKMQPDKAQAVKGPESQKQVTTTSGSQKPGQSPQPGRKQSSTTATPPQQSGGLFGFGGVKAEPAKSEESVTGKMFGFGSSIFSSASTLIASAVQDEPKTPPVSPKMQPAKETKTPTSQKSEQEKKQDQPQQAKAHAPGQTKVDKVETQKEATASNAPKGAQSTCPLCKVALNVGTKNPPNYNTCTECKSTVCNQCGFNPMPNVKEGKEWLCLSCQVKRASGGFEPQNEASLVSSSIKKTTPAQPIPQKTSAPGSPQRKAQPSKVEDTKGPDRDSRKETSPATTQKKPQESQMTGPHKQPDQTSQTAQSQRNATPVSQQETGGFFGFGGSKTQAEAAKPAESVTGKMFGFGSSFLSSASTFIASGAQEEPKVTPPVSPKMSAAKDSKSPTAKKPEQEKKPEQPQQTKGLPSVQPKINKPPSEPPQKGSASPVVSKTGQHVCPLCKLELNIGSKDPPNYSTCTECKNIVCNQCGFNPMPNVKEVKEWLCLNCQMQRALGASEPPGTPMMKQQASSNKVSAPVNAVKTETPPQDKPLKKDISAPSESQLKGASTPASPKNKPLTPGQQPAKAEVPKGPENQKQASPAPGQKTPQEIRKTTPQKPLEQTGPAGRKSSTISATQEESGGLFGFGGPKTQPEATKPGESLGGKMFGFGSSIFSSASTLINSAVQDESKKTPPVSPKMPAAKSTTSPVAQKKDQEKKQVQQPITSPHLQAKSEKAPSQPPKDKTASPAAPKPRQSTCPLCKVELNFGSKDPPNYNTCTECKETVCNQCGFNPMPNMSEVKEWLCLNCQMQRALGASEPQEPPMKSQNANKTANKTSPATAQQKISAPMVESLKTETSKTEAPPKTETSDTLKQKESSTVHQKTPQDIQKTSGSQKPTDQASQPNIKQSKVTPDTEQESAKLSGSSGPKTAPDSSKTTESVTGKMFGFGSSIFSSASTLITSAVQEESRTTPPGSRKMSAPAQVSPKMTPVPKASPKSTPTVSPKMSPAREPKTAPKPEPEKKPIQSQEGKENKAPSQPEKTPPIADKTSCPLCNDKLNINSKDPPNYSTCTECKTIVCNQCGFNPMPMGEVKEWLCLNCQMKRAVAASEPPGPPTLKSQTSPIKVPTPAAVQKTDSAKPATPQQDTPESALQKKETSQSPQRKKSVSAVQQSSPAPDHKTIQQRPQKTPDPGGQPARKQSNASAGTQQESGGFFGFGGPKSQMDTTKPAESVSGKMFGFGSSIFSSASTLITSAVQDQPKTTPPVSPKMSPAKEMKSPATQKAEQQKKPEAAQQTKTPPLGQAKVDKTPLEPTKTQAASRAVVKPGQSTCPLCKTGLNINSKDPPNYNTCTECKNTVCNQCGFNPTPNDTTVKEWLCLTCQMQRALGATQGPGAPSVNPQIPEKSPKKDITSSAAPEKKDLSALPLDQKKPLTTVEQAAQKTEGQKQTSPIPQKMSQEPGLNKSPDQMRPTETKQSKPQTQQDSGGIFGFGGGKKTDTAKPDEPMTGKMFGFGSSIFSSASTLITSAVQDQNKTTPPVSPKMSPAKDMKSPAAQKKEQDKKPEQPQQTKTPPMTKMDKAPSEPAKAKMVSQEAVKPGQSTCPLCKVELNMGSKDPPNYSICTECKNTVCNQCGFNSLPNVSEVKNGVVVSDMSDAKSSQSIRSSAAITDETSCITQQSFNTCYCSKRHQCKSKERYYLCPKSRTTRRKQEGHLTAKDRGNRCNPNINVFCGFCTRHHNLCFSPG
ncbi:protein piccolo-like [Sphaeramia orbicularis]|uniref:protein piccolo-like n=1 Tax=Sphaeramia orbicularis TaxID=375764 RepID=UPI001180940D|nr:protein piccolo-like [Sphaeramia orbicularis]